MLAGRKKMLNGHKKIGKRFITPINQYDKIKNHSYVNDTLPEIIWCGYVMDYIGDVKTYKVLEKMIIGIERAIGERKITNYIFIRNYKSISEGHKKQIKEELDKMGILAILSNSLKVFNYLYPENPLSFLVDEIIDDSDHELCVEKGKKVTARYINRFELPAIKLIGLIMFSNMVDRTLKFSSKDQIPDLNKLIGNPSKEVVSHVGGHVRALTNSIIASFNNDNSWCEYFWKRGIEIDGCEC